MSESPITLLPQGAGYGVVVGVGLLFGIVMILVTKFLQRFLGERSDRSEIYVMRDGLVSRSTHWTQVHGGKSFGWYWIDRFCCGVILDVGVCLLPCSKAHTR